MPSPAGNTYYIDVTSGNDSTGNGTSGNTYDIVSLGGGGTVFDHLSTYTTSSGIIGTY